MDGWMGPDPRWSGAGYFELAAAIFVAFILCGVMATFLGLVFTGGLIWDPCNPAYRGMDSMGNIVEGPRCVKQHKEPVPQK